MRPKKSYRIWMTQRTGSTLLCKGLESTGIAGKPEEFLTLHGEKNFQERYHTQNYQAMREKIWQMGTTENGVFGVKYSHDMEGIEQILTDFYKMKGMLKPDRPNLENLLADLLPNCKHIYLTRRNKIRQVVSWWKAIKDKVWHLEKGETQKQEVAFYENHYDFPALTHLIKELMIREARIQDYFVKHKIQVMSVVYEDLILDFEGTIRRIIDYLEIEHSGFAVDDFFYEKTATKESEIWVNRFQKDLGMKLNSWE